MNLDPRTPVIVGGGQVNDSTADAPEPLELLAEAARRAAADSGAGGVLGALDCIAVVNVLSRRYGDPGAQLAALVRASPRLTVYTAMGGHAPQALIAHLAARIQRGELDVALVGGAESWRTRNAYRSRGGRPPWPDRDRHAEPGETFGDELALSSSEELALGLALPAQYYPIFENSLRAAAGRSLPDHRAHIAGLWSRFSEVASLNPHAAIRRRYTPAEVADPGPANRMVCYPYTKLLNSNSSVDQGAAVLLASAGAARSLGVPAERWVFIRSAATASDTPAVTNRWRLDASPAIAAAGRAALASAGVGAGDLDHVDLYSCFPSAVQIAASALGLALDRPLTVTGGLTFAGGPWNNYATHAVATMAGLLRASPGATGLCTANGGLVTKHAVAVYSSRPGRTPFVAGDAQAEADAAPSRTAASGHHGPVSVESYTVSHDRDGTAAKAFVACLLPDGRRAWATTSDPAALALMEEREIIGLAARVEGGTVHLEP